MPPAMPMDHSTKREGVILRPALSTSYSWPWAQYSIKMQKQGAWVHTPLKGSNAAREQSVGEDEGAQSELDAEESSQENI